MLKYAIHHHHYHIAKHSKYLAKLWYQNTSRMAATNVVDIQEKHRLTNNTLPTSMHIQLANR